MVEQVATSTLVRTLRRSAPGAGGYCRLEEAPGEAHLVRSDLGSPPGSALQPLCSFLHLSDLHVTDVQSPARAEFLDRFGDPDSSFAALLGRIGVYRAQEALTAQVVEAMAQAARRLERGPVLGAPVEFALSTGDATDNCQSNELESYVALLDGGQKVTADSGEPMRFEGVGGHRLYDLRYWHPEGTPPGAADDLPRATRGFPTVPGLHDAAMTPFAASGLGLPWYGVYGNHDALFGGTIPKHEVLAALAASGTKRIGVNAGFDPVPLIVDNETSPPDGLWALLDGPTLSVTPDPRRRPVSRSEWIGAHLGSSGSPAGHGFTDEARLGDVAYYAFDRGPVRFVVLDTVNSAGGWQGCIDAAQLDWLERELIAGHRRFWNAEGESVRHDVVDRLFVLVSHHPLETLINGYSPDGTRRVLSGEVAALISRFPNVVCWVNGHTHENAVRPIATTRSDGGRGAGCWQLTTASHIDWPQQSRLVELALDPASGDLVIIATMVDHLGAIDPRRGHLGDPLALAGWSRELAANAWQGLRDGHPIGAGGPEDRNVTCTRSLDFTPGVPR